MSSSSESPVVEEAERIALQFDYPTSEVLRGVKAYIEQMKEGLAKENTTLSQIPTYVTGIPTGTEKVCSVDSIHTVLGMLTVATGSLSGR
jgi:hexokinase